MKQNLILVSLLLVFTAVMSAQNKYELYFSKAFVFNKSMQNIYLSNGGFDVGINKLIPVSEKNLNLNLGIETGINSVAFFFALRTSVEKEFNLNSNNNLYFSAGTSQGIEFFKPNFLYMLSVFSRFEYTHDFFINKKLGIFCELVYYNLPKYIYYSTINQFWAVNTGITFRFY